MANSAGIWKPIATKLIDQMVISQVKIDNYYLFDYVDAVDSHLSSNNPTNLRQTGY